MQLPPLNAQIVRVRKAKVFRSVGTEGQWRYRSTQSDYAIPAPFNIYINK